MATVVVCALVVYVLAFYFLRNGMTMTAAHAKVDGGEFFATTRLYYFSKDPGLHRALYFAFTPLIFWQSESHVLLQRGDSPAGSTAYIDDVAWLYEVRAQGFEANLSGQ